MTGTVREWRGSYGFIGPDGGGHDLFVHYTGIVDAGGGYRELAVGQRVQFDLAETERGLQALRVQVIGNAEQEAGGADAG